jgi:hypothetical protein
LRASPTNNNKLLWWRYGSKPIENATPLHPAAAKSLPDAFFYVSARAYCNDDNTAEISHSDKDHYH